MSSLEAPSSQQNLYSLRHRVPPPPVRDAAALDGGSGSTRPVINLLVIRARRGAAETRSLSLPALSLPVLLFVRLN